MLMGFKGDLMEIPSGNLLQFAILNGTFNQF